MAVTSLLLSGYVDGGLRAAAQTEGPGDFWPGPLLSASAPPTDCTGFDRIWTVSRADIEQFYATGEATADLAEWPHQAGAPVIDGDGDPSTYDLAAGDQPDLVGDVAAYWVMNDAGNAHGGTPNDEVTAPLGVEVRAHVFAFTGASTPGLSPLALQEAPFLRIEVVNRRSVAVDSLRLSLLAEIRIGGASNNLVGTDTLQNLAYAYVGRVFDEGSYGSFPPAWGVQVLRGPVGLPNRHDDDFDGVIDESGERLRLTTSPRIGDWQGAFPRTPSEVLNVQRGRYADGRYARQCSFGHPLDVWAYPGDPWTGAGCTEDDRWPYQDLAGRPGYRTMVLTVGATTLPPGASAEYLFAMPFARSEAPNIYRRSRHSTKLLREVAASFQTAFGDGFSSRPVARPLARVPEASGVTRVRPNPGASGQAAILSLPEPASVDAVVLDALGRRVAVVASGAYGAGEHRLAVPDGLPPGAYVLRVSAARGEPVSVSFTVVGR